MLPLAFWHHCHIRISRETLKLMNLKNLLALSSGNLQYKQSETWYLKMENELDGKITEYPTIKIQCLRTKSEKLRRE
jgi:hypothetical protein